MSKPAIAVQEELPPAIDLSVIEMLRSLAVDGEADPVVELTQAFVEDGANRLAALHTAISKGDVTAARMAAHSLKGMSGALGATHLSVLSREIERAEPGALDRGRIARLEQEFHRVAAALRAA